MNLSDIQPSQEYLIQIASRTLAHMIMVQNIQSAKKLQSEGKIVDINSFGVNIETINDHLQNIDLPNLILHELKIKQSSV